MARPTTTVAISLPTLVPAPVTPAQRPFGTHSARGVASWFNAPDGTCAHTTIPVGTVVRVTRLHNGAVTTCIVDQWGPADTTRIIDLSMDTFEKLAAPEAGLIDVLIEW
ncbi:MAG: septal ring lytic transglycosylase RlpA family protein [Acidimicrobiales bacterium]